MIDFSLTEKQETVRQMIHWFAENEVRPIALESDRNHQIPPAFLQKVKDLGISMGGLPKELGGEGEGLGEAKAKGHKQANRLAVLGAEEMAWGDPAIILTLPGPGLGRGAGMALSGVGFDAICCCDGLDLDVACRWNARRGCRRQPIGVFG